jgi:Fe-Mn family superoxide dismutase
MAYLLPSLPYSYDALEPYFDSKTMQIHHTRHHQTYINNANKALEGTNFNSVPVEELLTQLDQVPENKRRILRNNAGGHANHCLFWNGLGVNTTLQGVLKASFEENFGSVDKFKAEFEELAMARFGSGWVWLVSESNKLMVVSTANQDNPLMGKSICGVSGYPVLGLDLWEHSYYLKYQNKRPEYLKAFWSIVNWNKATERFSSTLK